MYARVTRTQSSPDRQDDGIATFKAKTVPGAKALDGNLGALLLVDRETGAGMGVTYWAGRAQLEASEAAANDLRSEVTRQMQGTVVGVDRYELVIQERVAPPSTATYVRVNRGRVAPGKMDDLVASVRSEAVPLLRGQRGFRALIVGVDREGGQFLISSVWDSADDREASNAAIKDMRSRVYDSAGAEQVDIHNYEVAVAEVTAGSFTG